MSTEAQAPEVENYWADVPAGATLWGLAVFTADEPIEIMVRAGKVTKAIRGRFGGQRLVEYSWTNTGKNQERVAIRASAMAGDRELVAARVQFVSEQHIYIGFGQRSKPVDPHDRIGGYPYDAVFIGFVVFES